MPLIYDIFGSDPHRVVEMQEELVETMAHVPTVLGDANVFTPRNPRTRDYVIGSKHKGTVLLPFSADGEPPEERDPEGKNYRSFRTMRIAEGSTVYARELAALTMLTGDAQLAEAANLVAERMVDITSDVDATKEYMRLAAVRGYVLDPADNSVRYDFFDEWRVTRPAEIDFALTTGTTKVRQKVREIERRVAIGLQAPWSGGGVMALCSAGFYDSLIGHDDIEKTYLNQQAANDLRNQDAFDSFTIGSTTFVDYRNGEGGAADIAIADGKAVAFPRGVNGAFLEVNGPADEFTPYVNRAGRPYYGMTITDRDRQAWDRVEGYAYPLMIPTRMGTLYELGA